VRKKLLYKPVLYYIILYCVLDRIKIKFISKFCHTNFVLMKTARFQSGVDVEHIVTSLLGMINSEKVQCEKLIGVFFFRNY